MSNLYLLNNPGVLQNFAHLYSLILILSKHFTKQVFAGRTYIFPNSFIKEKLLWDNILSSWVIVLARKRNSRADKSKENDSEAPNIWLKVARLVQYYLWCHISDCAAFFGYTLVLFESTRVAKVSNFDTRWATVIAEENIKML